MQLPKTYYYSGIYRPVLLWLIVPAVLFLWAAIKVDETFIHIILIFFFLLTFLAFVATVVGLIKSRGRQTLTLGLDTLTLPAHWRSPDDIVIKYSDVIEVTRHGDIIYIIVKLPYMLNADEPGYETDEVEYSIDRRHMKNRREFEDLARNLAVIVDERKKFKA